MIEDGTERTLFLVTPQLISLGIYQYAIEVPDKIKNIFQDQ
jgi:hypothetical protein